jgi:hypothetical protein
MKTTKTNDEIEEEDEGDEEEAQEDEGRPPWKAKYRVTRSPLPIVSTLSPSFALFFRGWGPGHVRLKTARQKITHPRDAPPTCLLSFSSLSLILSLSLCVEQEALTRPPPW